MKIQTALPQMHHRTAVSPVPPPLGPEIQNSGDRFSSGFRTGALVGAVAAGGAGLLLASKLGETGLAVAGGIGGALTGGLGLAYGVMKLIDANTSGGDGAVLALGGSAVGLVAGAIAGGIAGASGGPIVSTAMTAAGLAFGGAIVGGTAGFFFS